MQLALKKDIQRAAFSAAVALTLHALVFLAVELAHLLRFESEGPAYGAMFVDISDLKPDAGVLYRPETAPQVTPPKTEPPKTQEPKAANVDLSVTNPNAPPEVSAAKTPEKRPAPAAPAAPPTNVYSVKEANGSTLGVEMGNKTDIAKPNWRSEIILPKWIVDDKTIKLFVKISFVVGRDGLLSADPVIEESSGYADVDEAVKRAMINGRWKFSNPTESNYVVGTLTYKVNQ